MGISTYQDWLDQFNAAVIEQQGRKTDAAVMRSTAEWRLRQLVCDVLARGQDQHWDYSDDQVFQEEMVPQLREWTQMMRPTKT